MFDRTIRSQWNLQRKSKESKRYLACYDYSRSFQIRTGCPYFLTNEGLGLLSGLHLNASRGRYSIFESSYLLSTELRLCGKYWQIWGLLSLMILQLVMFCFLKHKFYFDHCNTQQCLWILRIESGMIDLRTYASLGTPSDACRSMCFFHIDWCQYSQSFRLIYRQNSVLFDYLLYFFFFTFFSDF